MRSFIDFGCEPDDKPKGGWFRGYYCATEEIAPLHEETGFQTMVVAAAEPALVYDDESYIAAHK